jgi:flagellar L-ring protein precursor FlgH
MRAFAFILLLLIAVHHKAHGQDTTRAGRRYSWTTDRPRVGMGDIVTVLIDERALASATLRDNSGDSRNRGLSANAAVAGGINQSAAINSANNADTRRNGEQVRQSTFNSEVSARVVEVSRSGMLRIEGEKELRVDRALQRVIISGWVRPNDIAAASNTVESWRLADAQVRYQQKGNLGKPKRGIIMRILGIFWP